MLTRFHKILLAVLAAQLVLVVIVLTRGEDSSAQNEHPLLAGFDAAKVTRLQVFSGGNAKAIDLVKRDASWVLASGFDYPVDQTKVNDVLTPIAKLAAAAPIATQTSRHKQLRVADTDFERKLVITRDGKDLTLYIGSAAGPRRTALRIGGSNDVHAVSGISTTAAGSEARRWVDPGYVKIAPEEIAKLVVQREGATVELTHAPQPPAAGAGSPGGAGSAGPGGVGSGSAAGAGSAAGSGSAGIVPETPPQPPAPDHWYVAIRGVPITLGPGESVDEPAVDRIAGAVGRLELSSPADPKRDASKPTATITIERKATGASTPAPTILDVIADGDSYWVHDRGQPRAVLVDKARLDEVINVDREKVVKKPAPPAPPPGAGSAAAPAPGAPRLPGMGSAAAPH